MRRLFGCCMATGLALAAPARAGEAQGEEQFFIAVRGSFLTGMFHQTIAEQRPIAEVTDGTSMNGTASTVGDVTAAPFSAQDGLGFNMLVNTTTNAYTMNSNAPRPDIFVDFDWTIDTQAFTSKGVLLRESGFALYGAQTSASSTITLQGLSVEAEGILWRLKRNIALRRADEQLAAMKAQNEATAAQRIAGELNAMIDKRVYEALLPINFKYVTYVYRPLVEGGLLGGHIGLGSDPSWLVLRGKKGGDAAPSLDVASFPELADPSLPPVFLRLSASLLERIAQLRLGGTTITEAEVAEILGRSPPRDDSLAAILGSPHDEVFMTFDEERPLLVAFDQDVISLSFRCRTLETLGQTVERVVITRSMRIDRQDGRLLLRQEPPRVVAHYDGSPLDPAVAAHIKARFGKFLPPEPKDLGAVTFDFGKSALKVHDFSADQGQLVLGLAGQDQ